MSPRKNRIRLIGAFAALASLALAVSCRGFFVNPTLTSLAIGPSTVSLNPGQTFQMTATGTFNDGSTLNVTSKSIWSSSDSSVASIGQTSGVATAASNATNIGTTTITASDGSITATTTATVTVCPVVSNLTLSAPNGTSGHTGTTLTIDAKATVGSSAGADVTSIVTWNIGDSTVLTISNGTVTLQGTAPASTTVGATLCNVNSVNALTFSIN